MASRQNLAGRGYRGGRGGGYGYGPLAGAYGGPANLVNPKMEEWRRQQSGEELVRGDDRTKARIAKAQQTGVGRGTQEQIVRHTTPGGGGYNRAEAMARERQLATRPLAEQMAMLGRKANPNAGDKSLEGMEGAINVDYTQGGGPLKGDEKGTKWTPEARKRWQQDQADLKNPFGPRIRKDEEGKWSAEQKQMWRKGETPRQQMAGITGGEAGMERARRRMAANTGQPMPTGGAAEAPWKVEAREAAEAEQARTAVQPGAGESVGGFGGLYRDPSSKGSVANWGYDPRKLRAGAFGSSRARAAGQPPGGSGFGRSKRIGGRGGLMSQALQRRQAGRKTAGPDRSPVVSANRRARQRVAGLSGGSSKPKATTGGMGSLGRSPRSRGRRGMGF